ncbi:alpha-mannosidase [Paenibacillus marinisediminis]
MSVNNTHHLLSMLVKVCPKQYWAKRIVSQLEYINRVSLVQDHTLDSTIAPVIEYVLAKLNEDGTITELVAKEAERKLASLSKEAKQYTVLCAAHAHLDMNFMWGWTETVSATLNTFRTMLDLLEEYPDYLFSHSQAASYQIVEKYDPEMLSEIKARVQEGRWELTASTWVEADKNMPSGESMARQLLYAKQYLSELFEIDPDRLQIDFEPDTFGHSINVPEALKHGGVKYYYYCRGHRDNGHHLFRWMSPSGSSVIAYKEPHWYDSRIEPEMVMTVPAFCKQTNLNTMLKVYGVGDHGGGPTRRDIERILDMQTWPIFPNIEFSTYHRYFELAEQVADQLPVVKDELNFIFTGCYSSESRLKMANRASESLLHEAESFSSLSTLLVGTRYDSADLADAWQKTCFNQFHDILPGSCVLETREHAMGLLQDILATANTKKSNSLRRIAAQIDTSAYIVENEDVRESMSEGAGAGVGVDLFRRTGESERGKGMTRVFHVFNCSIDERDELAEMVIWDWNGELSQISFYDANGDEVPFQFFDRGFAEHWGHFFLRVLLKVKVPPMGYNTYVMKEKPGDIAFLSANDHYLAEQNLPPNERYDLVLENERIRAAFQIEQFTLQSLVDKQTNREYVDPLRPAGVFRFIEEDTFNGGGNAWLVGRYRQVEPITKWKLESYDVGSDRLRQSMTFSACYRNSKLKVTVSLDRNSTNLKYSLECDWKEIGQSGEFTPQLNFHMPVNYACRAYRYDIPFGTIEREAIQQDVPANSFMTAVPADSDEPSRSVMLLSDAKHGFRGVDQSMAITLLRASYSPDPYPEIGMHRFTFAVSLADHQQNREMIREAYHYHHPLESISVSASKGTLPLSNGAVSLEQGQVAISAIKVPEANFYASKSGHISVEKEWIMRVYETEGKETKVKLRLSREVKQAYFVDFHERTITDAAVAVQGSQLSFDIGAHQTASVRIVFQ